jgi:hypothetical protein
MFRAAPNPVLHPYAVAFVMIKHQNPSAGFAVGAAVCVRVAARIAGPTTPIPGGAPNTASSKSADHCVHDEPRHCRLSLVLRRWRGA